MVAIKTVGDIVALIRAGTVSENKLLADHSKTLLGPRRRGSAITEIGLEELDPNTSVERVKHELVAPDCECYFFSAPMGGRLRTVRFGKLFAHGHVTKVRQGEHCLELTCDTYQEMPPTNAIYVIVGDHAGERAVFTWHPGPPLGDLKDGITTNTGVKLINFDEEPVVENTPVSESESAVEPASQPDLTPPVDCGAQYGGLGIAAPTEEQVAELKAQAAVES